MSFQPESAVDTAFWRYQETNAQNQVTNELYINLGLIRYIKTRRVYPPAPGGQTSQVAFWFFPKDKNEDPDITIDGAQATQFLSDMDDVFA